jgi:hypothetical protein
MKKASPSVGTSFMDSVVSASRNSPLPPSQSSQPPQQPATLPQPSVSPVMASTSPKDLLPVIRPASTQPIISEKSATAEPADDGTIVFFDDDEDMEVVAMAQSSSDAADEIEDLFSSDNEQELPEREIAEETRLQEEAVLVAESSQDDLTSDLVLSSHSTEDAQPLPASISRKRSSIQLSEELVMQDEPQLTAVQHAEIGPQLVRLQSMLHDMEERGKRMRRQVDAITTEIAQAVQSE